MHGFWRCKIHGVPLSMLHCVRRLSNGLEATESTDTSLAFEDIVKESDLLQVNLR